MAGGLNGAGLKEVAGYGEGVRCWVTSGFDIHTGWYGATVHVRRVCCTQVYVFNLCCLVPEIASGRICSKRWDVGGDSGKAQWWLPGSYLKRSDTGE